MKHYRIVMTTGSQNNSVFDCKFFVCFTAIPLRKHNNYRAETGRGGKKKKKTIRATVWGIISCVVQELRQSSGDVGGIREQLTAKKQTIQLESDVQKGEEKNQTKSFQSEILI